MGPPATATPFLDDRRDPVRGHHRGRRQHIPAHRVLTTSTPWGSIDAVRPPRQPPAHEVLAEHGTASRRQQRSDWDGTTYRPHPLGDRNRLRHIDIPTRTRSVART